MKSLAFTVLGLAALAPASAADWSDTAIGLRTGTAFQEPGIPDKIRKNIVSLSHVSGYAKGGNFFNVDLLTSDEKDPANAEGSGRAGGAHEVYVVYSHSFDLGKWTGTNLAFGPVRGIDFTLGFDYNAKNTRFAPAVFKTLAGPSFAFDVPGFLNVGLLYYKEKNHNAISGAERLDVTFDATYRVAAAWGIPVQLGPAAATFKGFATYTGAKGKDGFGVETKPETLVDAFFLFDISPLLGAKKGTWQIGPGYEFWHNKFGGQTVSASEAALPYLANPRTSCVMAALEYHF